MILWVVLFVLIVAISLVLAAQSMRDFSELPAKEAEYSLFLIRNTQNLTPQVLDAIRQELRESHSFISFERLFKGNKSALAVFGPRLLLLNHQTSLDLLELEDYSRTSYSENLSAWEMVVKKDANLEERIFSSLPQFSENDQFWFQVVIPSSFRPQITCVFLSSEHDYKQTTLHNLQNISTSLHKLPKAYSNPQILEFYQNRGYRKDNQSHALSSEKLLKLILI